jgi:hypothetical protein
MKIHQGRERYMSQKIQHIPSVPPVVFNERLAAHLKKLDKGAEALAMATKGLAQRLDEHARSEHLSDKAIPIRKAVR